MYNTDLPTRADLPSSARLILSTVIAVIVAAVLLVVFVLPSEYGIDPLRIGRVLGLTQMGEIKVQLASEAAADSAAADSAQFAMISEKMSIIEQRLDSIIALLDRQQIGAVVTPQRPIATETPVQDMIRTPDITTPIENVQPAPVPAEPRTGVWTDEISIALAPGQGVEFKLVMSANAEAEFEWIADGGVLNFDTHGDGGGNSVSYEQGRSVAEDQGTLRAAFEGNHGWFFRNRTEGEVTLILRTRGNYSELKRTV